MGAIGSIAGADELQACVAGFVVVGRAAVGVGGEVEVNGLASKACVGAAIGVFVEVRVDGDNP